jgi:hypothetical protein
LIGDSNGPVYRKCEPCGKTTGWIKRAARSAATPLPHAQEGLAAG